MFLNFNFFVKHFQDVSLIHKVESVFYVKLRSRSMVVHPGLLYNVGGLLYSPNSWTIFAEAMLFVDESTSSRNIQS